MPLQHILTKPIDWESVRQQHEQMVKYATALRLGTALRRFTRKKRATPTYKAIAELGKAIKTIFLCRYLHDESLRPEIHDWITRKDRDQPASSQLVYAAHHVYGGGRGGRGCRGCVESNILS